MQTEKAATWKEPNVLKGWIAAALLLIGISGCDLFSTQQSAPEDRNLSAAAAATMEAKTELAQIEKTKQLELKKMENETRRIDKERELELFKEKARLEAMQSKEVTERFWLFFAAIGLLSLTLAILYLLYTYRKNKLKAYEDNLAKYFAQKENEARVHIAEKILETMAEGGLSPEQKSQLINAFQGGVAPRKSLPDDPNLIEQKLIDR